MPSRSFRSVVLGREFLETVLAAMSVAPLTELVDTPKVRLSKDPAFNPTSASAVAELAAGEADFSGYTAGGYAVTLGATLAVEAIGLAVAGNIVAIAATATPFVQNSVYGYWIDDGTNVLVAEKFLDGQQVSFGKPGDYLDLHAGFPLNFSQPG